MRDRRWTAPQHIRWNRRMGRPYQTSLLEDRFEEIGKYVWKYLALHSDNVYTIPGKFNEMVCNPSKSGKNWNRICSLMFSGQSSVSFQLQWQIKCLVNLARRGAVLSASRSLDSVFWAVIDHVVIMSTVVNNARWQGFQKSRAVRQCLYCLLPPCAKVFQNDISYFRRKMQWFWRSVNHPIHSTGNAGCCVHVHDISKQGFWGAYMARPSEDAETRGNTFSLKPIWN